MRVLTIGSASIDAIASLSSDSVERMTMHNATSSFLLLEQGKKVDAEAVTWHFGGGAVNAAVALQRLGFQTSIIAKLGADRNGDDLLAFLRSQSVCTDYISRTDAAPTAATVMVSAHDRNAAIFTYRGANGLI